jgi:ribose 5-phosphate isomerase A
MTQDELKALVGQAALAVRGARRAWWAWAPAPPSTTSSTRWPTMQGPHRRRGVQLGQEHRAPARPRHRVLDSGQVQSLPVYIDGADEIDPKAT